MHTNQNDHQARQTAAQLDALKKLGEAPQYPVVQPVAPEPRGAPLEDVPLLAETLALRKRIRRANPTGGNVILAMWAGELTTTIERYTALADAERNQVAEAARIAAVPKPLPTAFSAVDDVAIVVLASWQLCGLTLPNGTMHMMTAPICFIPRAEREAYAVALADAQQRHSKRLTGDITARDRRIAIMLDDWSTFSVVADAYDLSTASVTVGDGSPLQTFISLLGDARLCVRFASQNAEHAKALYARADTIAARGGMSVNAARAAARKLWPTTEDPGPVAA